MALPQSVLEFRNLLDSARTDLANQPDIPSFQSLLSTLRDSRTAAIQQQGQLISDQLPGVRRALRRLPEFGLASRVAAGEGSRFSAGSQFKRFFREATGSRGEAPARLPVSRGRIDRSFESARTPLRRQLSGAFLGASGLAQAPRLSVGGFGGLLLEQARFGAQLQAGLSQSRFARDLTQQFLTQQGGGAFPPSLLPGF